jgi:signal transduction histidine kinase
VALRADLLAQLAEVRASRARIVDAADAERRRVERNLHDGAQQHLLLAFTTLGRVRSRNAAPDLAALIGDAAEAVRTAQAELRELARGLHPPLLAGDGLAPALEALAQRLPLPGRRGSGGRRDGVLASLTAGRPRDQRDFADHASSHGSSSCW